MQIREILQNDAGEYRLIICRAYIQADSSSGSVNIAFAILLNISAPLTQLNHKQSKLLSKMLVKKHRNIHSQALYKRRLKIERL